MCLVRVCNSDVLQTIAGLLLSVTQGVGRGIVSSSDVAEGTSLGSSSNFLGVQKLDLGGPFFSGTFEMVVCPVAVPEADTSNKR